MAHTVVREVLDVVVVNGDLSVGPAVLDLTWRALVVALVMTVPSPATAELGAEGSAVARLHPLAAVSKAHACNVYPSGPPRSASRRAGRSSSNRLGKAPAL